MSTINRDAQLSTVANLAYSDNPPRTVGDWAFVTRSAASSSGFFALAYVNHVTKEVVVSYRGTDGIGDLGADIAFKTGSWHPQFEEAAQFTARIKNDRDLVPKLKDGGYSFLTTGHSLGGGIAQLMGKMFSANGASFDAPGASAIVNSAGFAAAQAKYAGDSSGQIGGQFYNYVAQASVISSVGSHLGNKQSLINLADPSVAPLLVGVVGAMTSGAALSLLGLGFTANMIGTHPMAGIERAMHIAAGLDKALGNGSLQMSTLPISQATGTPWLYEQAEPQVVVFKDRAGQIKAYIQRDGDNWIAATPDQSTVIRLSNPKASDAPVCTVQQAGKESYSCTMAQSGESVSISEDTNNDGKADRSITTTHYDAGSIRSETRNGQGQLVSSSTTYVQTLAGGQTVQVTETVYHLATGSELARSKEMVTSGGARIVNTISADGHIQEDTWAMVDGKQTLQSSKIIAYSPTERQAAALDVSLAGLEFVQALRSGNKLQAASSLVRLVNNAEIASNQMPTLGAFGTGFAGAVSLVSALDSWGDASDGQRIALAARAVLGANEVAKAFSANGQTGFLEMGTGFTVLNVAGGIVALASLESTIESGNPFAIASSAMAITNSAAALGWIQASAAFGPQAMICVAIASIVFGTLFSGEIEYPAPPPAGMADIGALADGTLGLLFKDQTGKVYQTRKLGGAVLTGSLEKRPTGRGGFIDPGIWDNQNWGMGAELLSQRMSALINDLQAQANKDGKYLVLERLPGLSVHAFPSFDRNGVDNFFFSLRFNDPRTGAEQFIASANQDLVDQYKELASYVGAVVDATEWAQIQAKLAAGDAWATEAEGQYVDRLSGAKEGDSALSKAQADAQETLNRQTYSLLTLDLEGNGIARRARPVAGFDLQSVKADTTNGITRLDVDNDGFLELTEWVGGKEAILGLDRDRDGQLTSANELLTGGELSDVAEGLGIKRLAFFDANKDGKLNKLDPYFQNFKLWLDINGDARTGVGEVFGLAEVGVQTVSVTDGSVVFADGQKLALQTTQLSADVRGVAVSSVADGKGGVLVGQFTVQQEGHDPELNLTADAATDLGDILKLVKPNANVTEAEKAQLRALAAKYGVDLSNPAALLGLGGGGNVAGSPSSTTAGANDVFTISQAPSAAEIKQALRAFFLNINHDPDAGPALVNHVLDAREDTQFKIKTADLLAGLAGVKLVSVQDARRGVVRLDTNGDVLFNPTANQTGTGYFTYTAKDSQGRLSTAMVWLTIASVNDAPVAVADSFSVKEDNTLTLAVSQLLANDSDVDLATDATEKLTVNAVSNARHGTVSVVNGQVAFKAEADYQGLASFEYTVTDAAGVTASAVATVTVVGENDAPVVAGSNRKIAARPDGLLRIEAATLLAYVNDADLVYGDSLKLRQVVSVSAGNAWSQKDGSVLFKAGALGDAVLKLEVADSQGSTVVVPIVVNVSAANATAAAILPGLDQASEDQSLRIGSTQTIVGVVSALRGSTWIDTDGLIVFTPQTHYNGAAQVVYAVRNADGSTSHKTVDFNIAAVNDAPVLVSTLATQAVDEDGTLTIPQSMVLATVNDVDIATNGQTLRVSKVGDAINGIVAFDAVGNILFTPNKDFNGPAKFTYWVSDDAGATVAGQASVAVRPINDSPKPLALKFDLFEDERRTFSNASLIANAELVDVDTKTNGDVLKVVAVSMAPADAAKGTVVVDGAGNVSFAPTANYYGTASFIYTVTDSAGAKGQNTVTLNIAAVNDAPLAKQGSLALSAGLEDTTKIISFAELTNHFTDVDGDALTVRSVTAALGGSVTISNGQVIFSPVKDFNGTGTFNYTVADPSGAIASSTATVAFTNVNDAPVAAYKRIEGRAYEDADLRIGFDELTRGAYDADGDAVTLRSVRALGNGSAWIDWNNRQVVFRGNPDFNGWASIEYKLADASGALSESANVDIAVMAVNDNPTVRPWSWSAVWEDGHWANNNQDPRATAYVRLSNFLGSIYASDVDGDTLSFGEFWGGNHVWEARREGNDVLVRLERNYSGFASFDYRVWDNRGGSATGQFIFSVMPQNDRPTLVGLPNWPDGAYLNGNFNARIFAQDVDSPVGVLGAGIYNNPIHGNVSLVRAATFIPGYRGGGRRVDLPGFWDLSYTNRYGDEFSGRVGFNLDVWDHQGGYGRQYVETYHQGSRARRGGKPVAIDLNGDGIHYTNLADSKVLFDINGDGVKDLLSWTAADDGMIAFDKNGDGLIQELDELSFLSYLAGSLTDLQGLNGFDTDKDAKLTSSDAMWSRFGVWQDKNQNGVTDEGEFKNLDEWGIRSINLTSDQMMDQVGDVYIMGRSTYQRADGTQGTIEDAAFRYLDAADANGASQPKTFNIDIEQVIQKRIEEAHQSGASDAELNAMLQRFIADVAGAGRQDVEVAGTEATVLADGMYADPASLEASLKQQALIG